MHAICHTTGNEADLGYGFICLASYPTRGGGANKQTNIYNVVSQRPYIKIMHKHIFN